MNVLKRSLQDYRGYVIPSQPWDRIVSFYSGLVARGVPLAPMLRLVEALAGSSSASELFAFTSMHTLILSGDSDLRAEDSTLRVNYQPDAQQFLFEHRAFSGTSDQKVCPEAEALFTLSLFLRYKFGVLFPLTVA